MPELNGDFIKELRHWQLELQRWRGEQEQKLENVESTVNSINTKLDDLCNSVTSNKIAIAKIAATVSLVVSLVFMVLDRLIK